MAITERQQEKHIKRVKQMKKNQLQINDKLNFLLVILVGFFLIFCFIMAPVNAAYDFSYVNETVYNSYSTIAYQKHNSTNTGIYFVHPTWTECNNICLAGSQGNAVNWVWTTSNTPPTVDATGGGGYNWTNPSTQPEPYTWKYQIFMCECSAMPYGTDRLMAKLSVRSDIYCAEVPLSASFGILPSYGNNTLKVNFTPLIQGCNLNRAVWDYDGGLGSETKVNDMNSTFYKWYNTSGHWVARLSAYNNSGSVVTASKNIDVYNYSAGITPTPTLTPTPTPIGQTNTTGHIQIKGYDASNLTDIQSLSISEIDVSDTGSGWFNVTAQNGTYTFIGYSSGGSKPLVINHQYMYVLGKTGYATYTSQPILYTGSPIGYDFPLTPTAYVPAASNFVLGISLLDGSENIYSSLSGTVKISNQSSTWSSTVTNPTNGFVNFAGLTPSASYKIDININGYESYTGYFASSSAMAGTTQYYYANLESVNKSPSIFTLSVTPESGTVNDTYSIKINGDLTNADKVTIRSSSESKGPSYMSAGSGYTQYSKVAGVWKQWDGSSFAVTASPTGTISAKILNQNPSADTYTVTAYITISGQVYECSDTITVISLGKGMKIIVAYDMSSGGGPDAPLMTGYTSHIFNYYTGLWTNTTYTLDNFYNAYYEFTEGDAVRYYGSADGYFDTAMISKSLYSGRGGIEYRFYKNTPPPTVENVTLHAAVRNVNSTPISLAKVVFSDGQTCTTNTQGSCGVYALAGVAYSAKASAYGYTSGMGNIVTNNSTSNVIDIVLVGIGYNPTTPIGGNPTWTPIGTRNVTIPPTLVMWDNTSASVCGGNETTLVGYFKSKLACNGCETGMCQAIAITALLLIFFVYFGSRYGKAAGAGIGAITGFVISYALGFIPFMFVALAIVLLILFGAILLFQKT